MNERIIRASYDENIIVVYQAFNTIIAEAACAQQTFVSTAFKRERMTWIKPSFLWMMYRSGWASKENQERILEIKIKRSGFEWALRNSCLSHFDETVYTSHEAWANKLSNSPVRIQWDPERNILLKPLDQRSIQIGLSGIALEQYLTTWLVQINDITCHCKHIKQLIDLGNLEQAKSLLPSITEYPLPIEIKHIINHSLP